MLAIETVFGDCGEIDLFVSGDRLVLSICEERPSGCNRAHSRKATLQLAPRDVADLRRALDSVQRANRRPARWSDASLQAMAEEAVS